MVKITALFGHPTSPTDFEEHFTNNHRPLVDKIPNLQRFEAAKIVATPDGSELTYYRISELYFESMEQMQSGMDSHEGQAATEDIPNFATGRAMIFISEVDA